MLQSKRIESVEWRRSYSTSLSAPSAMFTTALLAAGILARSASAAATNNCDVDAFDKNSANMILFGVQSAAAQTRFDFYEQCIRERHSVKLARKYNDFCLDGLARDAVEFIIRGIDVEIVRHCNQGPGRGRYLRKIRCINEKNGNQLLRCNKDLTALMEGVSAHPYEIRLPLICCLMGEYTSCLSDLVDEKCGETFGNFTADVAERYTAKLYHYLCDKFRPYSSPCDTLPTVVPASRPRFTNWLAPISEALSTTGTARSNSSK